MNLLSFINMDLTGQSLEDVENVTVIKRTEFELTLQWKNINTTYSYELEYNRTNITIPKQSTPEVNHTVSSLSAGTKYSFTLYTVFENVTSSGYNFTSVTVPSNVEGILVVDQKEFELTLQWNKIKNNNNYSYVLKYKEKETIIPINDTDPEVRYTVPLLYPGTKYSFTLFTEFEDVLSSGKNFSNVTVPSNVVGVSVVKRNDTAMNLQWNIVTNTDNNTYNYTLNYRNESTEETLPIYTDDHSLVICEISGLIPATNYIFILYTIFEDVRSKGYNFTNYTTLSDVTKVRVTNRTETHLTIEWDKLNKDNFYNYTLKQSSGNDIPFTGSQVGDVISHVLSQLKPGTVYDFTLYTVVNSNISSGTHFKNVTTIDCASIDWHVTNSSINAMQVNGSTRVTAKNSTHYELSLPVEQNSVNLQSLYPGAIYTVSLWYDFTESDKLLQCSQNLTLAPNSVSRLHCNYFSGGYGLEVVWDAPYGVVNVVQLDVAGNIFNQSENRQQVNGLQVAKWYRVTATSFSGNKTSPAVSVNCQTDPTGVIAGVLVSFLVVILICAGVFLWLRKRKHVGGSKQHVEYPATKVSNIKMYKPIRIDTFPEHFQNMSRDENRGFSEEYEDLGLVGLELPRETAKLPENKSKNRFSNVLAYDCSRVHLSIDDDGDSDYINANYMPGYGKGSKQYIAAQGPLPSTINDFWRMVWERRSNAIIMVTNCTERGTTKCEQYWPLDYTPCLYGNLLVTVTSEDKAQSWTLREFFVNNKDTSETRTVKHFHFTAWPDHGVPLGTEELIQFRGLVRQHIESSSSAGPTVVHCSAGVGRTGTLIALDVLLQQLEREKAVGIAEFVQKMRLNRPLMVQTESQYVFLHQCIIDTQRNKNIPMPQEPLYENAEMIFANAMALKEYDQSK
ncbi:receptor-type tyrosine-protein phosphatase H isoform X2 [Triplophysa dalaica]|uniref:receptor-type tyrosine-protein phosphatase H isoform X2 n=1 Tax=Triplophysa dalaica TaxID=1582913 RepID=UPI0024DF732F|nr:receptor-type tyrosine-protein phosphatase H isoform X2 [Triplophysa dalaica]